MNETDFSHRDLPVIGKRVLRLGVASNYGLDTAGVLHAAERGAVRAVGTSIHDRVRAGKLAQDSVREAGPLTEAEDAWVRQYGREVRARKKLPFI